MSKYDYGMELPEVGSSIRWGYDAVEHGSYVLELGCANGLLTRHLKLDKNCEVDVVEIDEQAGTQAKEFANTALLGEVMGNLEQDDWYQALTPKKYDVIVILDVLEHVRNPHKVLEKCRNLLKDTGSICISVPNIGHNSVIINLINNKFEYQELGILDSTHLRFFCQDTLEQLVKDTGYAAVEKSYTRASVGANFIENSYDDVEYQVANALKLRNNAEIFQFTYKLKKREMAEQLDAELQYQELNSTLYYNTGDGYSEEHKIVMRAHQKNNEFIVDFDVRELQNVQSYRWDPVEMSGTVIAIQAMKIESNGKNSTIQVHDVNALDLQDESKELFLTADPNYEITGNIASIQRIQIVATIQLLTEQELVQMNHNLNTNKDKIIDLTQLDIINKENLEKQAVLLEEQTKLIAESQLTSKQLQEELQELKEVSKNMTQELLEKAQYVHTLTSDNQELKIELDSLRNHLFQIQTSYNIMSNSTLWKMTKPLRFLLDFFKEFVQKNRYTNLVYKGVKSVKNEGIRSAKNKVVAKIENKRKIKRDIQNAMNLDGQEKEMQQNTIFEKNIKFSIVVPLYNTPLNYLVEMIESVQAQTYQNWELCMADGSDSEHKEVEHICRQMAKKDERIKYKKLESNNGISENTNACLAMSTGDYIGLFDHDDLLHPSALYYYMVEICKHSADFIYCDELTFEETMDKITVVHYKPDFAIDNLRANNYICHFTVFGRSLLEQVGGFRKEFDGSQDHDMVLRLTEKARSIRHVPKILYYWRGHPNSVAMNIDSKTYAIDAGKRAVKEHLMRCGYQAEVTSTKAHPAMYKITYEIIDNPLISILIPNKDGVELLKQCINSILSKTTYRNYEIVIVENNSTTNEIFTYYKELEQHDNIRVVTYETGGVFNYSNINNFGEKYCNGEYILLLNNDIEIITPEWIEEMLMYCQRSDVGAVGSKLYYPNDTIQHGGVILGVLTLAGHSHKHIDRDSPGYMGRLAYAQNMTACTAACLMVKKEIYDEIHGFDPEFAVAFNDIDLCMRIRQKGYLICWTPFAEMYHHESITRGEEDTPEKQERFLGEVRRFQTRWKKELEQGDPYYNVNFSLDYEDFRFK